MWGYKTAVIFDRSTGHLDGRTRTIRSCSLMILVMIRTHQLNTNIFHSFGGRAVNLSWNDLLQSFHETPPRTTILWADFANLYQEDSGSKFPHSPIQAFYIGDWDSLLIRVLNWVSSKNQSWVRWKMRVWDRKARSGEIKVGYREAENGCTRGCERFSWVLPKSIFSWKVHPCGDRNVAASISSFPLIERTLHNFEAYEGQWLPHSLISILISLECESYNLFCRWIRVTLIAFRLPLTAYDKKYSA
jgi:hypothetical protein